MSEKTKLYTGDEADAREDSLFLRLRDDRASDDVEPEPIDNLTAVDEPPRLTLVRPGDSPRDRGVEAPDDASDSSDIALQPVESRIQPLDPADRWPWLDEDDRIDASDLRIHELGRTEAPESTNHSFGGRNIEPEAAADHPLQSCPFHDHSSTADIVLLTPSSDDASPLHTTDRAACQPDVPAQPPIEANEAEFLPSTPTGRPMPPLPKRGEIASLAREARSKEQAEPSAAKPVAAPSTPVKIGRGRLVPARLTWKPGDPFADGVKPKVSTFRWDIMLTATCCTAVLGLAVIWLMRWMLA